MIELLYKKKVIRDFLSLFTENNWKALITSLVEYGIITLKKQHNIASLTADEIIQIVESLKQSENLVENKKQKLSLNKIINKNNGNNNYYTTESRSRSKSKNSENSKFGRKNERNLNHEKLEKKSIPKSKSPNTFLKKQNNSNITNNYLSNKKESSEEKSKKIFNYEITKKDENKIKNLVSQNSNNSKREASSSASKINRKNSKEELNLKNQFGIRKYSKATHDSDTEGNYGTNNKTNLSTVNKSYLTVEGKRGSNLDEKNDKSKTLNTDKKKNTKQILEQINLNKLKEKMKKQEIEQSADEIKLPNNLAKKYSKVESKIRTEIEKDKKIFNLIKTANDKETDGGVIYNNYNTYNNNNNTMKQISTKANIEGGIINIISNKSDINNHPKNIQLDLEPYESDRKMPVKILENNKNSYNTHVASSSPNLNNSKDNSSMPRSFKANNNLPISLEDRLNGLTQKISDVEKNSKLSDLNLNNHNNYNYTLNNNYTDNSYTYTNSNNKSDSSPIIKNNNAFISETNVNKTKTTSNALNENYIYRNNIKEEGDDDYLDDDKFDLNKYKYLYQNNYGDDKDNSNNSNDEYEY